MGRCSIFWGDYPAAEHAFRRELEINEKSLGEKNAYVAADLASLALLYSMQGKKAEAEAVAQQSAEALFESTAVADPQNTNFLSTLLEFYMLEGEQEKAISLAKQAADRGVRSAGQALRELRAGWLLLVSPLDLVLWERRAPKGRPVVQDKIRIAYQVGKATHRNYVEALRWYRMAAEQGYAPAENNLGWMYDYGFGSRCRSSRGIPMV